MSPIKYLYCLTRYHRNLSLSARGLGEAMVYPVRFRNLAALVSDWISGSLPPSEKNALAHHAVVAELFQRRLPVVPCRFGTMADNVEGALVLLKKIYRSQMTNLTSLAGMSEWSVRLQPATWDPGNESPTNPATPANGAAYLNRKKLALEALQKKLTDAEVVMADLNAATSPHWQRLGKESHQAGAAIDCSLHYLVPWKKTEHFCSAIRKFQLEIAGWKLHFSGPWPPYFFAETEIGRTPLATPPCAG